MEKDKELTEDRQEGTPSPASPPEKKPWEEPKLAFVEPKLTKHGDLEKVTGNPKDGFFGPFSP
jgi:hypothetical protein